MPQPIVLATAQPAPSCALVVFGASGDLARRKLLPAIYDLDLCGDRMLGEDTVVIGCGRTQMPLEKLHSIAREAIEQRSRFGFDDDCWKRFAARLDYVSGIDSAEGFVELRARLKRLDAKGGIGRRRVFYLAIPPGALIDTVRMLSEAGLIGSPSDEGFTRVVVEKPIGTDLASALEIQRELHRFLDESQIFRIDHYLGKETVQNLMVLRFANSIFEEIWNTRQIDNIQITVAETEGLGTRAGYYEGVGALRDMVQNHMLQVLALVAMEPPISLEAEAVRHAKLNLLKTLQPLRQDEVRKATVRAQYRAGKIGPQPVRGYQEEEHVPTDSKTETFVALKLKVENWRWSGVPFYLRTGKRLSARSSEVAVVFKEPPDILFNRGRMLPTDVLTIRIQPDEGFSLDLVTKRPGLDLALGTARMDLHYAQQFEARSPEAYERLLLDVMDGDRTLFVDAGAVEESWKFVQGILDEWANDSQVPMDSYEAGSWGPDSADRLLAADGRRWRQPDAPPG